MRPIEELRYLILAAQREGNRILSEALRPLALTPSQAEVLRVLQDYQPLSLFELGQLLVCETGSPSRLVNGLVETGLIARAPSQLNGRKVILELTPNGQSKANQVRTIEEAMYSSLSEQLPDPLLAEILPLLRNYVSGRPSGNALVRRIARDPLPNLDL
jgi:MarR family transcriptional regulator, organic hydroperoxide resistance regulator